MASDVIYFELNNWRTGRDHPDDEPFVSWMSYEELPFRSDQWAKEQQICVVADNVDMSLNFCITATRGWVLQNCPSLLNEHTAFLRTRDECGDVCGRFGHVFLDYAEENFGVTWAAPVD